MNIYEAAIEMLGKAKRDGRTPLRWDINATGLVALQAQSDFSRNDDIRPMIERKLLSLPMALTHDNSEDPKLALVVEEAWRRGPR